MKEIQVTQNHINKGPETLLNGANPGFGKVYADHMFVADIVVSDWKNDYAEFYEPEIRPHGNISISPACYGLHYAQIAFEGMQAFKDAGNNPWLFRPDSNWARLNDSLARTGMPKIRKEDFMQAIEKLVALDSDWIMRDKGYSLYIRPIMFCDEEYIGVREENKKFRFVVITSPNGGYKGNELKLYVPRRTENGQREYVRAVTGGTGSVKASANYAGTIPALRIAKENGCDDVLWMDALTGDNIEEIGTNNAFFYMNGKIVTPQLSGSILPGISRDSAITLLRDMGYVVEERVITLTEVTEAFNDGKLEEAFATGTAASVKPIVKINCQEQLIELPPVENAIGARLKKYLDDIKWGRTEDKFGWMHKIESTEKVLG